MQARERVRRCEWVEALHGFDCSLAAGPPQPEQKAGVHFEKALAAMRLRW